MCPNELSDLDLIYGHGHSMLEPNGFRVWFIASMLVLPQICFNCYQPMLYVLLRSSFAVHAVDIR